MRYLSDSVFMCRVMSVSGVTMSSGLMLLGLLRWVNPGAAEVYIIAVAGGFAFVALGALLPRRHDRQTMYFRQGVTAYLLAALVLVSLPPLGMALLPRGDWSWPLAAIFLPGMALLALGLLALCRQVSGPVIRRRGPPVTLPQLRGYGGPNVMRLGDIAIISAGNRRGMMGGGIMG